MNRKDMDLTTLYAIESRGVYRPGYVLDIGKSPGKITVKRFWRWAGDSEGDGYLNGRPELVEGNAETFGVTTKQVLMPWIDYCIERKADLARLRSKREAEEQAAAQERDGWVARVNGVKDLLDASGTNTYIDHSDMLNLARGGRLYDTRYSAKHVLELLEAIAFRFDITPHIEREGQ